MAIESLTALILATVFLVGLTWYVNNHRLEDKDKQHSLKENKNGN